MPEGYTSHDVSHTIDGVFYDAESSQAPARVPTKLKLERLSTETTMLLGAGNFDLQKLRIDYYLDAPFRLFGAKYSGDLTDQVQLMAGTLGLADVEDERSATLQLQSLSAPANQPVGRETSPLCQCKRFGRRECANPIDDGQGYAGGDDQGPRVEDYTDSGVVTQVSSAIKFRVAGVTTLAGWSDARCLGIVRFTSGDNFNEITEHGAEEEVKSYDAETGEVTLRIPLPYLPQAGDTLELERGCDKAFDTCKAQPNREGEGFTDDGEGNYRNFAFGFPFIPLDKVTAKQS